MSYKQRYEVIRDKIQSLEHKNFNESRDTTQKRLSKLGEARQELNQFINESKASYEKQVKLNGDGPELDDLYITIELAKKLR